MNIHFRTLCEIEVAHGYYPGPCPDVDFVVPGATPALAAGRLLVKTHNGRLLVLFEADDAGLPVRNIAGSSLLIGLRVSNPYFANFTAPPVPAGALPIYANTLAPRSFDPALAGQIAGARQRIVPALAGRPLVLRWQTAGQTVAEQTLIAGQEETAFVTAQWPAGRYTLTEDAGGAPVISHWLVHPELAGQPLWGVLALTIDAGFYTIPPQQPPLLAVPLTARRERLKYYVVARNYGVNEFGNLNVNDAGAAEQGRPPVAFEQVNRADFADDDLPPEVLGDAASRIVLFQSQGELDRRAGGYRKLQLRRNNEVLVQHLPQAGSDRAQARFIVHLAKS